jgi:hypothetical protein
MLANGSKKAPGDFPVEVNYILLLLNRHTSYTRRNLALKAILLTLANADLADEKPWNGLKDASRDAL